MAFSGVVLTEITGLPIAGAQIYSVWDGTVTSTGGNGQFYLKTTLPTSWQEGELAVSAAGYSTNDNYYDGKGLVSGLQIYLGPPPPNDNFANRTVLTGSNVSTNGDNFGATAENGEPYDSSRAKSVWFSWTAPSTRSYVISVSTTNVQQPILAIYTGTQLSSLAQVAIVSSYIYHASYTLNATAGEIYQIEIDTRSWQNGGPYTLSIAP